MYYNYFCNIPNTLPKIIIGCCWRRCVFVMSLWPRHNNGLADNVKQPWVIFLFAFLLQYFFVNQCLIKISSFSEDFNWVVHHLLILILIFGFYFTNCYARGSFYWSDWFLIHATFITFMIRERSEILPWNSENTAYILTVFRPICVWV